MTRGAGSWSTVCENQAKGEHAMSSTLLRIGGAVEHPLALTYGELAAFPEAVQFADVSRLHPSRKGTA